jgi:hypothetical protein
MSPCLAKVVHRVGSKNERSPQGRRHSYHLICIVRQGLGEEYLGVLSECGVDTEHSGLTGEALDCGSATPSRDRLVKHQEGGLQVT